MTGTEDVGDDDDVDNNRFDVLHSIFALFDSIYQATIRKRCNHVAEACRNSTMDVRAHTSLKLPQTNHQNHWLEVIFYILIGIVFRILLHSVTENAVLVHSRSSALKCICPFNNLNWLIDRISAICIKVKPQMLEIKESEEEREGEKAERER